MGVEGEVRAGRRLLLPACSLSERGPRSIDRAAGCCATVGGAEYPATAKGVLPLSPCISLCLTVSPSISLYLPVSPVRISPRGSRISRYAVSPGIVISRYPAVSRHISPYSAADTAKKKRPRQGFMTMSPIARRRSQPAAGLSSEGPAAAAARPAADTPSPLRCCRAWRRRRSASSCLSQTGLFLKFLRGESQRDVCVPMIWCGEKTIPWMPCRTVHAGSGS